MSVLDARPKLRWLVPAAATLAVIGGGAAIGVLNAAASPALAPRSAQQLLVDLQTARPDGLSGTIVARVDLGLPALPGLTQGGGQGSAELTSLASGTHTLRVWFAAPDQARVALLGTLGETDVITNGSDVWTWSSKQNQATHTTLPSNGARQPRPALSASANALTPAQLADAVLKAVDPTTEVSTTGTVKVAGRDAYHLVLSPRDAASRVGSVRLAVDAQTHLPLRVEVYPRAATEPAIDVGFTQVSFERPDPAQFRFNPPPGATVVEQPGLAKAGAATPAPGSTGSTGQDRPAGQRPIVVGHGWTSVLVAPMPQGTGDPATGPGQSDRGQAGQSQPDRGQPDLSRLLSQLPRVSGAWGSGRLLAGNLFSVLITDDGRVLVGAVSPDRLLQAAADPAARLGAATPTGPGR
ncbi:MAG TPA: outer membrane lipoprotein carrier protein LolA [Micromonosporaceae bacterium]